MVLVESTNPEQNWIQRLDPENNLIQRLLGRWAGSPWFRPVLLFVPKLSELPNVEADILLCEFAAMDQGGGHRIKKAALWYASITAVHFLEGLTQMLNAGSKSAAKDRNKAILKRPTLFTTTRGPHVATYLSHSGAVCRLFFYWEPIAVQGRWARTPRGSTELEVACWWT